MPCLSVEKKSQRLLRATREKAERRVAMVKVKGDLLAFVQDHLWPRCMPSFFTAGARRVTHSSVGDGRAPLCPLLVPRAGPTPSFPEIERPEN